MHIFGFPDYIKYRSYNNSPIAKTWGGSSPKERPWYFLIVVASYSSRISLYGFTAINMLAT